MHKAYEQYAAETAAGGFRRQLVANDRRAWAIETDFIRQVRLDRAALELHRQNTDPEWRRVMPEESLGARALALEASGTTRRTRIGSRQLAAREGFLFSNEGVGELFLVEEWAALEGYLPFHRVFFAALEGRSLGRPPES